MDTLKKIAGAGGKEELSGQEPVSGVQGGGTADQPFDAGNEEGNASLGGRAPQQTNSDVKASGQEPVSGVQGAGTADKPFDAGNSDDKADLAGKAPQRTDTVDQTIRYTPASSTQAVAGAEAPRLEKKPTIGSAGWFANPFAKKSSSFEGPERDPFAPELTPAAEGSPTTGAEKAAEPAHYSSLPPNHLGADVPPGQDTIVEPTVDPAFTATGNLPNHLGDDVPPGQLSNGTMDKGKGKAKMSQEQAEQLDNRQDFPSHRTESSSISTRRESVSTQYTIGTRFTHSTAPTGTSIAGSSRRASAAVHIVTSQGKPITAGGVPLGLPAMEERERRLSFSVPEEDDLPPQESNTARKPQTSTPIEGTKQHDFASPTQRPAPVQEKDVPTAGREAPPAKQQQNTEAKTGDDTLRRRSSIMVKAKDFGRRMRHSISK